MIGQAQPPAQLPEPWPAAPVQPQPAQQVAVAQTQFLPVSEQAPLSGSAPNPQHYDPSYIIGAPLPQDDTITFPSQYPGPNPGFAGPQLATGPGFNTANWTLGVSQSC
jgi:hypothetical protein